MTRYLKGGRTMFSFRFDPAIMRAVDRLAKRQRPPRNRTELMEEAALDLIAKYAKATPPKVEKNQS